MTTVYIVLGIGRYYGSEGWSGDDSDAGAGADSVRLVTTNEDQAKFLLSILDGEVESHRAKLRAHIEHRARIHREEVGEFLERNPGPQNPGYAHWPNALRDALQRCNYRWDNEVGEMPPYRPDGVSEKYVIVSLPLGQPINVSVADVVSAGTEDGNEKQ